MTVIAVADPMCNLRAPKPNETGAYIEIHDDGRVYQDGALRREHHLTPEAVRRLKASLEFPGNGWDMLEWEWKRRAANQRRQQSEAAQ